MHNLVQRSAAAIKLGDLDYSLCHLREGGDPFLEWLSASYRNRFPPSRE